MQQEKVNLPRLGQRASSQTVSIPSIPPKLPGESVKTHRHRPDSFIFSAKVHHKSNHLFSIFPHFNKERRPGPLDLGVPVDITLWNPTIMDMR
jgi:hypothetical protein